MKNCSNTFLLITFFLFTLNSTAPAQTVTPQVQVNSSNSVVLSEEGKVYTFGHNNWGELGQGNINRNDIPGAVDMTNLGGKKIWKIGEGFSSGHQLFITEDSTLAGFGSNSQNQLSAAAGGSDTFAPVLINAPELEGLKIVQAVQGDGFSYVLTDSGHVYFMGINGDGSTTNYSGTADPSSPITVPTMIDTTGLGDERIVKISSSANHRLLLGENGTVFGLGENNQGQLGTGNNLRQYIAVPVDMSPFEGKTVVDIATGAAAGMVLTSDGAVFTTGSQNNPALGQGDLSQNLETFTEITHPNLDGKTIIQIAMTREAGFLLSDDGILYGMGSSGSFVQQDGINISSNVPIEILNSGQLDSPIAEVALGGDSSGKPHFVLTTTGGQIYGFGHSGNGQTGTGYTTEYLETPVLINLSEMQGDSFVQIEGGHQKTFYLDNNGLIYSNGGNNQFYFRNEQDGTSWNLMIGRTGIQGVGRPALIDESNLAGKRITGIAAGYQQTFLITEDGEVFGMGRAAGGVLGTGDSLDVYVPQKIDHSNILGKKIIKVATGGQGNNTSQSLGHTLLLADDGTVFGFGNNSAGQLGLGDRQRRYIPTELTDAAITGKTIVDIAVNGRNSMFIASDGTVLLSGSGNGGHMGFGDTDDRLVPTVQNHPNLDGVHIVRGAVGMAGGDALPHFILLSDDHRVFSFGSNAQGQLGQGDKVTNNVPTQITSLDELSIVDVAAGEGASLFRAADGSLYGTGWARRLGFDVPPFATYSTPTQVLGGLEGRRVVDADLYFGPSIALLDDGTVLTYGAINTSNLYGIYGNGEPRDADHGEPTVVEDFSTIFPISPDNLALHLDAGRGLTIEGESVSTWRNLNFSGKNGVQSDLARRPVVADSSINDQRAIRFNGTNSYITLPTAAELGIQNADYELFIVAKSSSPNIQFLVAGATAEQHELHLNGDAGARFIPASNPINFVDVGATGNFTDGTAQLINLQATDTYGSLAINRSQPIVNNNNSHSPNGSDIYLGRRTDNSFHLNGDIAEVIIYNGVLSGAERGRIEEYLVQKYAIPNNIVASATLTGTEGWRLLASPVADSSFAPLLAGIWTQGFTGAKSIVGDPNVYLWDANSTSGAASNWTPLGDISTPFTPGTGALVYVFDDDNYDEPGTQTGFPKTLPIAGIEPLGEQNLTAQINTNDNGWTLLGNPFRYDIRWNAFSKGSLSNAVYVYDNNTAGWKSWNGTVGSLTDGKIGAFNGFFVQTMGSGPEIIIPDSSKTYENNQFLGKERGDNPVYSFSLEAKHEDGLANKIWFQFSNEGSMGLDKYDAHKLAPLSAKYVNLGSVLNDSTILDINSLPLLEGPEAIEIQLQLTTTESGNFTFTKRDMNIPKEWVIELTDNQTGETSDLEEGYIFTVDQSKAKTAPKDMISSRFPMKAASAEVEPRFLLTILPGLNTGIEDPDLPKFVSLSQNYPNPFNPSTVIRYQLPVISDVRLDVFDIIGRRVAILVDGMVAAGTHEVRFDATALSSGVYIYRLTAGSEVFTRKLTLIK